jgi:ribosomal protein S18 acetylase RimI-like enzyme
VIGMIEIAQLPPDKWEDLKKIRLEALKSDSRAYGSSFEEEMALTKEQWQTSMNSSLFAVIDNITVGMIRYHFETPKKTQHIANIYGVYVSKEYRNQGIGNQLMTGAISKIKEKKGTLKVKLTVNPLQESAVRLYTRHGFTPIGVCKKELFVDGTFYDEMMMEKYL